MNPGDLLTPSYPPDARPAAHPQAEDASPLGVAWHPVEARVLAEVRTLLGCVGNGEVDAVRALLADLAEANAALLNERGGGAPPSAGWESLGIASGPSWRRRGLLVRRRELGWAWQVVRGDECLTERGTLLGGTGLARASGVAATAREAMRAADTWERAREAQP